MTGTPPDPTKKPPAKPDRISREAAALRANLLKRKEQVRRREEVKESSETKR
ncbi:MAG TPA: hypothetical protein PLD10_25520 [Rhodopila sp.]|nr:hypothetical protein [Rhodopila sp.]